MSAKTDDPSEVPQDRLVTLRYFAWVREAVGISEERCVLPADLETVADVMTWLQARGPEFAGVFTQAHGIRAALDHVHVKAQSRLGSAREIAFFPPVTGG